MRGESCKAGNSKEPRTGQPVRYALLIKNVLVRPKERAASTYALRKAGLDVGQVAVQWQWQWQLVLGT